MTLKPEARVVQCSFVIISSASEATALWRYRSFIIIIIIIIINVIENGAVR